MTYDVPYAFVPGTKAKADEVNANFNDVINKIQDTKNQVNENFNTLTETCNSISNTLSDTNTTLAAKANATDIDGTWTNKLLKIFESKTFSVGSNSLSYSLSSYLPNDEKKYEVLISGDGYTGSSNGASIMFGLGSALANSSCCILYKAITRTSSSMVASGCSIIPISTDRKINLTVTVKTATSGSCYLTVLAYRKVR